MDQTTPPQPVAPQQPVAPLPTPPAPQVQAPPITMPFGGYVSNPFRLTLASLGNTLRTNGIPLLYAALVPVAYIAIVVLVTILLALLKLGVVAAIFFFVAVIGFIFLTISLSAASIRMVLEAVNDRRDSFKNYYAYGRKFFWKMVGLSVLTGLAVLVPFIFMLLTFLPVYLRVLLTFVGFYVVVMKLSLAAFALIDREQTIMQSMRTSWSLTNRHGFEIFGTLVTSVLFGGGLLSGAATTSAMAGRYLQLSALKASNEAKPATHWVNYVIAAVPLAVVGIVTGLSIYLASVAGSAFKGITPSSSAPINNSTDYGTGSSTDYNY